MSPNQEDEPPAPSARHAHVSDSVRATETASVQVNIEAADSGSIAETTPSWTYREEDLAGSYLDLGFEALLDSANPERIFRGERPTPEAGDAPKDAAIRLIGDHSRALARRLDFSRVAILFAALAAEAYVNKYLQTHLARRDFAAADRLSTPEKFFVGTRLVAGGTIFERGRQPGQRISDLFILRNRLVHPKRERIRVEGFQLQSPVFKDFNPEAAAEFLIAVADAAEILARETPGDGIGDLDFTGRWIVDHRAEIRRIGSIAMKPPRRPDAPDLSEIAAYLLPDRKTAQAFAVEPDSAGDETQQPSPDA